MFTSKKSVITFTLGLLSPGLGQLYRGNTQVFLFLQLTTIAIILLFFWSRFALQPLGVITLLITILSINIASAICAVYSNFERSPLYQLNILALQSLCLALVLALYFYREDVLGIGLYHIPSASMQPTLKSGDIIIVDTWAYRSANAKQGDVMLFNKSIQDLRVFVKRIKDIKINPSSNQPSYFVVGDNKKRSSDSRHFGWVAHSNLIGKVSGILLTLQNNEITFERSHTVNNEPAIMTLNN
jgi:signal peptidase I